ncbi:hypothetical protein LCGC14_0809690 [marine sediment metagenome]|uniref:Ketosynthase family 3 (KS3) domain-containing protein n=1 Tax=marine sediment metagenome TaxID=412755 RepID=A0A0F9S790_9ZZZZ
MSESVDILSVGLVSAGGWTLSETWANLIAGKDLRSPMPLDVAPHVKSKYSYLVPVDRCLPRRLTEIARRAAGQALAPGSMEVDAVYVGSTSAAFNEVAQGQELDAGYLSEWLARRYKAPTWLQMSQACASSGYAIGLGADLIRSGRANVVLAGGADEVTAPAVAAFEAVRLHGDRCRPFDLERRNLVLGEAAAFVLLTKRGLGRPICSLDGVGLNCDAKDPAAPDPNGILRVILEAIKDAGYAQTGALAAVDLVIAHGTGTKINDLTESKAIMNSLGPKPSVTSYKGALGHPQGASGAVALALAIQALKTGYVFPTVGLQVKDPEIKASVAASVRQIPLERVLCLSSGSWGANAALAVSSRFHDE